MVPASSARVLVTGASGFSGTHLLRGWARAGFPAELVGVTRTGGPPLPGATRRTCELADPGSVQSLIRETRPSHVIHLAGSYSNDFEVDSVANVESARHMLEALRLADLTHCRVLIIGSAAEFGRPDAERAALDENAPYRPVSVYGLTKVFQTELARYYARAHGMPVIVARPFNLIGTGMSRRLLVGQLLWQIEELQRGSIARIRLGNLAGARDFLSIDDALRAYLIVLDRGIPGEAYNVGSGVLTPVRQLVEVILDAFGVDRGRVEIDTSRLQPSDGASALPADIAKLRALGWRPEIDVESAARALVGNPVRRNLRRAGPD